MLHHERNTFEETVAANRMERDGDNKSEKYILQKQRNTCCITKEIHMTDASSRMERDGDNKS